MEQNISGSQAPRTALMRLLDSLIGKRIIYIHAPAGFGKTVSSLLWLERRESHAGIKRALISLDEYDDNISEFCRRFISAFASLQPENTALGELAAHPVFKTAPVEFTLYAIDAFAETQDEYVLVLDDLHVIRNEEILNLLPALFARCPKNFTVLLLSRSAPPDSFSEVAAKGELAKVDVGHLQFTCEEIKGFFNKNGKPISSTQADEILASTGGWAIGIYTLLLSEEKDYKTKLTDRHLENFLKIHIWGRWSDEFKAFMMLVSVVEELMPELSQWMIADDKPLKKLSGSEMLVQLMRENAFLRAVGNNTYKFHDLYREFLLHMLEQQGERALFRQYNRAGEYFYGKKDYFRSVQYYSKAKNDDGVAKSLYHMYDYNSPYASVEDTLQTVRMSLSEALVEKHPFLLEVQAWSAFVEGRADEFEKFLDKYYKLLPEIILKNPRSAIIQLLLRVIDYRSDLINSLKILKVLPFFKENVKAYTPSTTQSLPFFHRSSRDYSSISVDVDKNMALFAKSLGVIIGEEFAIVRECLYAGFQYEKGNLSQAQEHALSANSTIPEGCSSEIKFCAMIILAASLLAGGQFEDADKMLLSIEDMIKQDNAFYLIPNFRAYQFGLKLSGGDADAAREWLSLYSESPYNHLFFYKIYQHFITARAYITVGDSSMAIMLLKKLLILAEKYGRRLDIIEAQILLAIAYNSKGKGGLNTALEHLESAAVAAYEYRYTQLFANEGAELTALLQQLQERTQHSSYAGKAPIDFIKSLYIAAVSGAENFKGLTGGSPQEDLKLTGKQEDLKFTDKQKEVMRLMYTGHSRSEIAKKMGLKPNGVKSHTELIYNKLGVSSSIEAALKIRELDLIEE